MHKIVAHTQILFTVCVKMASSEHQSSTEGCSQNYEQLHSFIKLLLKDKVFSGFYKERRLIESLSAYK